MAEFERIPLRPRPDRNWLPTAVAAVAVFIVVAIFKPWGSSRTETGADGATPLPTFYVAPTERTGPRPYDPILFGGREPDPAWELWPAGYVVEFGLAGPVRVGEEGVGSPAPGASAGPGASATQAPASSAPPEPSPAAASSPGPSAPPAIPPVDDGFIDLGTADHLVALGINTPADVHVDTVSLSRLTGDAVTPIELVRLPTYWESSHFIVIAPEDPARAGQAAPWEPGVYRLVLTTTLGEVRAIDLRVRGGAVGR